MSKMRDPFHDPQPGDMIEFGTAWGRTVIKRTPKKVWFDLQYGRDWLPNQTSSIAQWRRYCDPKTARVIRRGEDAQ